MIDAPNNSTRYGFSKFICLLLKAGKTNRIEFIFLFFYLCLADYRRLTGRDGLLYCGDGMRRS